MANSAASHIRGWHILLLICAALILAGLKYYDTPDPSEVRVTPATYQDIESSVSTVGKVAPIHDFQARANFSGMVEKVYVRVGDQVNPGQMLIRMKDQFAEARVKAAEVALQSAEVSDQNIEGNGSQEDHILFAGDRAHAELERGAAAAGLEALKQLAQNGAASPAEIGAATHRLQAADATLETLKERTTKRYSPTDTASFKARVAQARLALEAERVSFANANITSPIAGTVYLLPVREYDFVPAGADLLRVADLNAVEIRATFDEPDIGKLHDGQAVRVLWDGRPNRVWHGHIEHAPLAVMAAGVRSVGECTITVDDAKGDLPANTNVTAIASIEKRTNVLTIPREAMHTEGSTNFVYRVVNERLVRTPIETGMVTLSRVEVKKGLAANDAIALHLNDNHELRDNLRVKTSS